jgi:hypothetical protein
MFGVIPFTNVDLDEKLKNSKNCNFIFILLIQKNRTNSILQHKFAALSPELLSKAISACVLYQSGTSQILVQMGNPEKDD